MGAHLVRVAGPPCCPDCGTAARGTGEPDSDAQGACRNPECECHPLTFQSDKYPSCPAGKVPLSVKDPDAQDLLAMYSRRHLRDQEFGADLEQALRNAGYDGAVPWLWRAWAPRSEEEAARGVPPRLIDCGIIWAVDPDSARAATLARFQDPVDVTAAPIGRRPPPSRPGAP